MTQRLGAAAIALMTLALLLGAAPQANIYGNPEFGITLPIPKGMLLCTNPADEHDHGPVMLFDPLQVRPCNDAEGGRLIEVFASYNVSDDTKRLHDFLRSQCAGVAGEPCLPAPRGLRIPGMRCEAARVNGADGWIQIIVVTQAGKPDPAFDASVPSINYAVTLHTRPEHLDEDLLVFRSVLRRIRLSPGKMAPAQDPRPSSAVNRIALSDGRHSF